MKAEYQIYKGPENRRPGPFEEIRSVNDPALYTPSEALIKATNVAIMLGKPLLITGEPGVGKTQLAYSLAQEFYKREPLVFTAKTTSKARDLFYSYDAMRHFHDVSREQYRKVEKTKLPAAEDVHPIRQENEEIKALKEDIHEEYRKYIYLNALGIAILKARKAGREKSKEADIRRSVVLIDEIDKAPRDFPSDMLVEIENMMFKIEETNQVFTAEKAYTPIVVITSNSERLLPEPFLRRCIYYHIPFPSKEELYTILVNRLGTFEFQGQSQTLIYSEEDLKSLIALFYTIREYCRNKKPATAEFLSWVDLLNRLEFDARNLIDLGAMPPADRDLLLLSFSVLVKHLDDLEEVKSRLITS